MTSLFHLVLPIALCSCLVCLSIDLQRGSPVHWTGLVEQMPQCHGWKCVLTSCWSFVTWLPWPMEITINGIKSLVYTLSWVTYTLHAPNQSLIAGLGYGGRAPCRLRSAVTTWRSSQVFVQKNISCYFPKQESNVKAVQIHGLEVRPTSWDKAGDLFTDLIKTFEMLFTSFYCPFMVYKAQKGAWKGSKIYFLELYSDRFTASKRLFWPLAQFSFWWRGRSRFCLSQ